MRTGKCLPVILMLAGIMVLVQLVNTLTANSLVHHGIIPRTFSGLQGLLFAPFLHGSIRHLLSNLAPFVVLSWLISNEGLERYVRVLVLIAVLGGLLVWLLGRPSIHVGASGLIFGLWSYVLARAWFQRSLLSLLIAAAALLGYGGLVFGFLPVPGISFESHIAGAVAGIVVGWIMHSKTLLADAR
ncbi:rhomboid family intramembrane serine protease [Pseudomonas luteola]|uniref:rhomboid family intramembrane serine protease n=1 Tax=Pseudomonas luteola TaxID=47886 RepID=UPI000F7764B0|nr:MULTISPECIES: rhomboid family intramembrane serine protease [Pseudomonas]MBA1246623.1 rhomboid family intramembrane serine protease [Pseudomonas zeshuii]QEU27297.1 rhomboid family intramembrane serine protease [Pseudomonas luteola]RRW42498.1 rhomboid family intramembrane serine protease [Pseudomonas luteola]